MRTHEIREDRVRDAGQRGRIEEEIATLERRLAQIGPDGDCGYEKAMIRFFQQQIEMRRRRLGFATGGMLAG
jgi:hypothetical protein